jgi:FtsP/CotA-like multicopper oxidase with cupredoxin domain
LSSSPAEPRFRRRALLGAGLAGAAAVALPGRLRTHGLIPAPSEALAADSFAAELPIPRVITDAEINLDIIEAEVRILPGRKTKMWTYGGHFPGPTIRRPAGEQTKVTFKHRLPSSVGELSVHLHGGHTSSADDGQPGGLTAKHPVSYYCQIPSDLSAKQSGNDLLIDPGEKRTYTYELMEDGEPERAAFQWYHDHRLDWTARNVWHGLAGMFIIDDVVEAALPLPTGEHDLPLMIVDRSFDADNQLTNPFRRHLDPPFDGLKGSEILVNGAPLPHHHVAPRRYRLRFLNASQFRAYNLDLSSGASMTQIGTDAGLMPTPIDREKILIGPAERAEVVVDFAESRGDRVELRSVPRDDDPAGPGTKPFEGPLMQFRVGHRHKDDQTSVPVSLRPLPTWTSTAPAAPDRTWVFEIGGGLDPTWLVNGNTFDPSRSDGFPVLDTVESWQLTNATGVAHMFHMHSTDWYMLSRNGDPPAPWEDCLKETFFLDPGESVIVAAHFTDHLGKFVIHCHMLDHEDHGLMSQFEVVSAATKQPARDETAKRRAAGIPRQSAAPTLGLPQRRRVTGEVLAFTPEAPAGERLRTYELLIDGRHARTLRGDEIAERVRLAVPRGRPFRLTAVARTRDRRYLSAARNYQG